MGCGGGGWCAVGDVAGEWWVVMVGGGWWCFFLLWYMWWVVMCRLCWWLVGEWCWVVMVVVGIAG